MANHPHPKREQIISMLGELPPKVIAATLDVPYATVLGIKKNFFEAALKLKRAIPDPNQLRFRFRSKIRD